MTAALWATPAAGHEAADGRVVGGSVDRRTDNPWVAALLFDESFRPGDRFRRQFCTGSLIDRRWVLTAAHCVTQSNGRPRPAAILEVLVGQKNLLADPATGPGEVFDVVRVVRFPGYSTHTLSGDAALLKLDAPSAHPPVGIARNHPRAGTRSYIAGWGDRRPYDSSSSSYPTALHSAFVRTISDRVCGRSPVHAGSYVRKTMFCAGTSSGRPDTCQGDSGGPIAIRRGGAWRLIGVTSYGFCGRRPPWRGVYARITSRPIAPWIRRNVPDGF